MPATESHAEAAARLAQHARSVRRLRAVTAADPQRSRSLLTLKGWQSARLARTYPDLLAAPRYRGAALFFFDDLYGAKDFSQRDADIERILPTLNRVLPAAALSTLADSVELDAISEALDRAVVEAHVPVSTPDQITEASYAAAYRAGSDRRLREQQIEMIANIGKTLDYLTHLPMLYTTLKLMRTPARLAGLAQLQGFLEKGFLTFREMHGADEFLATIVARERRFMEALFAGRTDAFAGLAETG